MAVQGRYKEQPEDFVVEEICLYEPSGSGTHTWLWVEKSGLSTMQMIASMAETLGCREREIGYAGLKDALAVTRQWISIEGLGDDRLQDLESERVRILRATHHGNKLKLGHLRGNRFDILVRGASDADSARGNLEHMSREGVPNYFGEQRFGKRGANLDKGMRILNGNPRKAARAMPKRLMRLLISAVQSEVFNRVLVQRLETLDRVHVGDVAFLHRNGACFVVETEDEQVRCQDFEISPSGPLPGPKMLRARGEQAQLEDQVMAELDLEPDTFGRLPYATNQGARRPLRVPVWDPEVGVEDDGVRLRFGLPKGSYATSVLGELLEEPPWFGEEGG